jgi:hypothetical protein
VPGRVQGLRFYDSWGGLESTLVLMTDWASNREYHLVGIYQQLASAAAQWNNVWIHPNFRINTTDDYAIMAMYRGGGFFRNNAALASPVTRTGIQFKSGFQSTSLDVRSASFAENTNANAVDVLFLPD